MGSLKTAVVGLGLGRHFVNALAGHPDVDRLILCDPDADRAEELRETHSEVDVIYEQLEVMLEKEQPDAVCVVTPDHMHRPHSTLCFDAGSHVLQTKPLATNLDDARAIVAAAEATGKKLMVAHERRFRPLVIRIKEIIDHGEIGDLIHLRVDAISDKRSQFARAPWYASTESGRSALNGTGIHEVDLTRHYVGRPITAVSAFSNRLGGLEFPKDKTTAALFQFEGDIVGQVTVTYEDVVGVVGYDEVMGSATECSIDVRGVTGVDESGRVLLVAPEREVAVFFAHFVVRVDATPACGNGAVTQAGELLAPLLDVCLLSPIVTGGARGYRCEDAIGRGVVGGKVTIRPFGPGALVDAVGSVARVDGAGGDDHRNGVLREEGVENEVGHRVHRIVRVASREIHDQILTARAIVQTLVILVDVEIDEILLRVRMRRLVFRAGKINRGYFVCRVETGEKGAQAGADLSLSSEEKHFGHVESLW